MGEMLAVVGLSTAILTGLILHLGGRIDAVDAKFTARFDAVTDRLDRVIEMVAHHTH